MAKPLGHKKLIVCQNVHSIWRRLNGTSPTAWMIMGIAGTALALLIWTFSSKFIQDLTLYGAGLYALWRIGRGTAAWRQPAGIAFIAVFLHMILTMPFSLAPAVSFREFASSLDVFVGAFAIPVIFNTRRRLELAMLHSANAITLTLMYDIIRLAYRLGPDLMVNAHSFQPFILNHSNVASMMAGLSALIYFYFFLQWRSRRVPAGTCLAGILICLAYQIILASRGPQLALALTVTAMGMFQPGLRRKIIWYAVILAVGWLAVMNMEKINPRFLERETMQNLTQRNVVWNHTWQLSQQRPWFGHGYGKRNFTRIYYASDLPSADFYFPHPHQFWLKLLFEFGWTGVALQLAAWLILAWTLARRIYEKKEFSNRLWPGIIALMLLYIHLYGLADYPDNIVQIAQIWLIPLALTACLRKNG